MKLFTQLALVTAIATSGSAFAMQTMDDSALSSTTGQDGITILIAPPALATPLATGQTNGLVIGAAVLHDKDGLGGADSGGAIILGDASQAGVGNTAGTQMGIYGSTPITVVIDASGGGAAGAVSGAAPYLNINVVLPPDLLIRTGDISVDGSKRGAIAVGTASAATAATGGTTGNAIKILDSLDIALGGASLNIQLGNTPQGAMIKASGTITGGLAISNLKLKDANPALGANGGTLGVGTILIKDTAAANLTLNANIDVVANAGNGKGGLVVVSAGPANDIMLENVTLGSSTSYLGDLQLINVQSAGTKIVIQGH